MLCNGPAVAEWPLYSIILMKVRDYMKIENNIIKHYLKNVYFITGTAYAGKSTMVRMLAERYDMIQCGENYHSKVSDVVADVEHQPNISYFETMSGWQEFVSRTPQDYGAWTKGTSQEAAEFEIAELIQLSQLGKKIIVDTNISLELLHEIADYHQVAVMLSPQSMSVERFFDREDPEKQFLLRVLEGMEDPESALENWRQCIALVNSPETYETYANSGFFTLYRQDTEKDTREEVLKKLAEHFGL